MMHSSEYDSAETQKVDVFIGLGSNLENPLQQVTRAISTLTQHPHLQWVKQSAWYSSEAIGPEGQPNYVNGAAQFKTSLSPLQLLKLVQEVEQQHGRTRDIRWGARTLDLDILLYGEQSICTDILTVPHCELAKRNFVLQPLVDIDENMQLPDGRKIASLLKEVGLHGLHKIDLPEHLLE